MKKVFLLLSVLYICCQTYAQVLISGIIVDPSSRDPIPYVNVGIVDLSRGTVSDHTGRFKLEASSGQDVVTFSSIGYASITVDADYVSNYDTIHLESRGYALDAVEVVAGKFSKEVILGERNEKRGHSIGFGSTQLGTELGSMIQVEKPTYIKSANFVLNHAKGDSLFFRLNLYALSNGEIEDNLLKENVLLRDKQRKGTFSIDMRPYDLILENDVLMTLEWLKDFDELGNKDITFDTRKSKKLKGVYLKYSSNSDFQKMPHKLSIKPCFYLEGTQ